MEHEQKEQQQQEEPQTEDTKRACNDDSAQGFILQHDDGTLTRLNATQGLIHKFGDGTVSSLNVTHFIDTETNDTHCQFNFVVNLLKGPDKTGAALRQTVTKMCSSKDVIHLGSFPLFPWKDIDGKRSVCTVSIQLRFESNGSIDVVIIPDENCKHTTNGYTSAASRIRLSNNSGLILESRSSNGVDFTNYKKYDCEFNCEFNCLRSDAWYDNLPDGVFSVQIATDVTSVWHTRTVIEFNGSA